MAVLEKIRVKFGLAVSIIIALALLSFIIDPGTLETALNSMSSKYDVGKIAGKKISYNDYMEDVDKYTTINELLSGSSAQNEQQQNQIRNAAWQGLIDKFLFVKNAKAAGITVGEAELVDLTTGSNPSPVVAQSFTNNQGEFDPQLLVDFVQNLGSDETGRLQTYWNYLQNTVYNQQFYAKYGALFNASQFLNPLEKERTLAENNTTANIDYVYVMYPFAKDSSVVVSKSEIDSYYKAHKDFFKQNANRDIEYVVFEVVPSAQDIAAANQKINEVYNDFLTTDNVKAFLLKNSDRQLNDYWYKAGELKTVNEELDAFVSGSSAGTSPIIKDADNNFYAARIIASKMVPDSAYVKHILLQGTDSKALADSLLGVIRKGGNFAELAAEYSADQGSAADGELGNIGWMTQSYMIPGFESVITANTGEPFVLNTQFGTHVVMVSKKSSPILKKQVAILERASVASKETYNEFYSKANKFASIANHSLEGYRRAVDSLGVYSHKQNVLESTDAYGAIDNAKELTRWVFESKKGKASDIITVNNNYFFIAAVDDVHKEGIAPVDEVSNVIEQRLYTEKLAAAKKAEVAGKINGMTDLEAIATALGSSVTNNPALSLASAGQRGNDPALAGAALVAPLNQVYGPVAGSLGTYVLRVNSREAGNFFTDDDAKMLSSQKAQYSSQMILPVMMDLADVKDNRARFF